MASIPQSQGQSQDQDWVTSIGDSGEGGDCPRSCFLGCDQLSRTRFRLAQIDTLQDPLDLSHHRGCNVPCWNYFFLCVGTLYIGSGIYTAKVTGEIRKKYNIKGDRCDDVTKGIFCQPCSLIRNDLEVRRREKDTKVGELVEGSRGPMPLGERDFQPMFAMPNSEGYRQQPQMSAAQGGVAHLHQRTGAAGSRIVPLYPTDQDLRDQNLSWRGFTDLPQIPDVSSPLGIDRRSKLLTPITELDSSAEDPQSQNQGENAPGYPQVQTWLKSMSPSGTGKHAKGKKAKPCPGPMDCDKNMQLTSKPLKPAKKAKLQRFGGKEKNKAEETGGTPNIFVTAAERLLQPSAPGVENLRSPPPIRARRSPEHNLSADILIPSPSESQRQHSLQTDVIMGSPREPGRQHGIHDDVLVASPLSVPQHNLQNDARVPTPAAPPIPQHSLTADGAVQFLSVLSFEHSIDSDQRVAAGEGGARSHSISRDKPVADDGGRVRGHSLNDDELLTEENEPEPEPEPETELVGHTLMADPQVTLVVPRPKIHSIGSDTIVSIQRRLHLREHSLSRDIRVPTPTSQGNLAHGIHLDERVPTPELVRLNLEHDILRDRRVLTPSTINEEHNLQADQRVKTPASLPPHGHFIESDNRIPEPSTSRPKPHQIASDDLVVPGPSKRARDHSLRADTKVAQRAFQLLENFLEQDKRSTGRESKG
ncbi:hypothetical protein OQA88_6839 [Cercophora sp. LCS_1]